MPIPPDSDPRKRPTMKAATAVASSDSSQMESSRAVTDESRVDVEGEERRIQKFRSTEHQETSNDEMLWRRAVTPFTPKSATEETFCAEEDVETGCCGDEVSVPRCGDCVCLCHVAEAGRGCPIAHSCSTLVLFQTRRNMLRSFLVLLLLLT